MYFISTSNVEKCVQYRAVPIRIFSPANSTRIELPSQSKVLHNMTAYLPGITSLQSLHYTMHMLSTNKRAHRYTRDTRHCSNGIQLTLVFILFAILCRSTDSASGCDRALDAGPSRQAARLCES